MRTEDVASRTIAKHTAHQLHADEKGEWQQRALNASRIGVKTLSLVYAVLS